MADACVFLKKDMIDLTHVDDCIFISNSSSVLQQFVLLLSKGPKNFIFTDKGKLDKYLGVDIKKLDDGSGFSLTQPFLMECILQAAEIDIQMMNARPTPVVGPLLSNSDGRPCKHTWMYCTLTGMIGYLQQTSRLKISMATHQCARFNNDPKLCHECTIKCICKYLLGMMDKGLIFKTNMKRGLECYVDADFTGGWALGDQTNPESVLSRTDFVIMFAGCPIFSNYKQKLP